MTKGVIGSVENEFVSPSSIINFICTGGWNSYSNALLMLNSRMSSSQSNLTELEKLIVDYGVKTSAEGSTLISGGTKMTMCPSLGSAFLVSKLNWYGTCCLVL